MDGSHTWAVRRQQADPPERRIRGCHGSEICLYRRKIKITDSDLRSIKNKRQPGKTPAAFFWFHNKSWSAITVCKVVSRLGKQRSPYKQGAYKRAVKIRRKHGQSKWTARSKEVRPNMLKVLLLCCCWWNGAASCSKIKLQLWSRWGYRNIFVTFSATSR